MTIIYFNKNLVFLRESKGWTQQEVADKLGIKLKRYQAWEEKRGFPPADLLVEVGELFDVTTDSLLKEKLFASKAHVDSSY